jgi:inosine-uridine nucleoside N-ribohydrolase
MQGSVRRGYGEKSKPEKEYNIVSFIKASQTVFTAEWDMTITPLDTCGMVSLDGDDYKKILDCNSPITKAVIENYRVWAKSGNINEAQAGTRSTTLFDTVAVYLAMSHDLLETETIGIRVTDDGRTVIDNKAKKINCAMKWTDLSAFESFLVERLTSPAIPAPASDTAGQPAVAPADVNSK